MCIELLKSFLYEGTTSSNEGFSADCCSCFSKAFALFATIPFATGLGYAWYHKRRVVENKTYVAEEGGAGSLFPNERYRYSGEVDFSGRPHGQGRATWKNGRQTATYAGGFYQGKFHGEGCKSSVGQPSETLWETKYTNDPYPKKYYVAARTVKIPGYYDSYTAGQWSHGNPVKAVSHLLPRGTKTNHYYYTENTDYVTLDELNKDSRYTQLLSLLKESENSG